MKTRPARSTRTKDTQPSALWLLMDDDGPLDTLRHRSHVMCAVMERLSNESHNPEFDAYFAHAKDLHAAVVAIEQRLKEMKESEIDLRGGFNA